MTNEELVEKIQHGQTEYIPTLYSQVEKFLRGQANKYYMAHLSECAGKGVELDDLIQEGYFAVIGSIKGFKSEKGFKFCTYLGVHYKNYVNVLMCNRTSKSRKEPLNRSESLEEPISGELYDITLADTIEDENAQNKFDLVLNRVCLSDIHKLLSERMKGLSPKQHEAIHYRFFENMTLKKAGEKMAISPEGVRLLEAAALKKLHSEKLGEAVTQYFN